MKRKERRKKREGEGVGWRREKKREEEKRQGKGREMTAIWSHHGNQEQPIVTVHTIEHTVHNHTSCFTIVQCIH